MTYEPRVGDLVTDRYGQTNEIVARPETCIDIPARAWVRLDSGGAPGAWHCDPATLAPIRPDAPGQRVRGCVGGVFLVGVTRGAMHDPLRDRSGFYVEWDAGGFGPWRTDRLIRIADQAPAAQVEAPCPETPADVCAAVYGFTPGSVQFVTGPTCQHCGAPVLAGLLRDTCPRGCDLTLRAAEPEPSSITLVWTIAGASGFVAPSKPGPGYERVWCAQGGGAYKMHPTKDGAIAAWREAVRR